MTPRYKFWSCPDCDGNTKANSCLGDGYYCALDT